MAELTTLARPYAKAAFEYAIEAKQLAEWSEMLGYASAVAADEDVQTILDHPALTSEQKAQFFIDVCGDKLTSEVKNFVFVLSENNRLGLVSDIAELFESYKAQLEQSIDVSIESAFELGDAQSEKLAQALSKKMLHSKVDNLKTG